MAILLDRHCFLVVFDSFRHHNVAKLNVEVQDLPICKVFVLVQSYKSGRLLVLLQFEQFYVHNYLSVITLITTFSVNPTVRRCGWSCDG